jgi:hypothetical protein
MSRELERIRNALLRRDDDDAGYPVPSLPSLPATSFFSFRYSRTEISAHGSEAHVKRKETRIENGRLVTEEAEGTIDIAAYDRMIDETQRYYAEQMTQAMKLFFLPLSAWRRDRD